MKARVIIAGSRECEDEKLVYDYVNYIIKNKLNMELKDIEIVSGCAKGVDKIGEKFAISQNIPLKRFPARWKKYGKSAGFLRNLKMANYAGDGTHLGVLIAFPYKGRSAGTRDMIAKARLKNLTTYIVELEEEDKI